MSKSNFITSCQRAWQTRVYKLVSFKEGESGPLYLQDWQGCLQKADVSTSTSAVSLILHEQSGSLTSDEHMFVYKQQYFTRRSSSGLTRRIPLCNPQMTLEGFQLLLHSPHLQKCRRWWGCDGKTRDNRNSFHFSADVVLMGKLLRNSEWKAADACGFADKVLSDGLKSALSNFVLVDIWLQKKYITGRGITGAWVVGSCVQALSLRRHTCLPPREGRPAVEKFRLSHRYDDVFCVWYLMRRREMMARSTRQWGEGLSEEWIKKPSRMTSAWEEVRKGEALVREISTYELQILNHTTLLKLLFLRERN